MEALRIYPARKENISRMLEDLNKGLAVVCQVDGCTNIWTPNGWCYCDYEFLEETKEASLKSIEEYFSDFDSDMYTIEIFSTLDARRVGELQILEGAGLKEAFK